ncbi:homocitrate synthase [Mycobacterium camsae]|uniref:homocitrate synthase n=1 Tax=Mycobacterium gordonae TaxID=1778 RepID=UPI00197F762F|nr:homocitrate synthase [Mycobacterium gordonae]
MTILSQDLDNFAASTSAAAWFGRLFGVALPRGLREQVDGLSWEGFVDVYGHTAGPVRLRHWSCDDAARPATRIGPHARNFRAVIAVGDRIGTSTAAAGGAVAALTAMLHGRGIPLEVLSFHQICSGNDMATLVRGTDGVRTEWAMGWAADSTESALRAVIACVNRLLD